MPEYVIVIVNATVRIHQGKKPSGKSRVRRRIIEFSMFVLNCSNCRVLTCRSNNSATKYSESLDGRGRDLAASDFPASMFKRKDLNMDAGKSPLASVDLKIFKFNG